MSRGRQRGWLYGSLALIIAVVWFFPAWLPASARQALEQPDRYELLSLGDPDYSKPLADDLFHRRVLLGSAEIKDPAERTILSRALRSSAKRIYFLPLCFTPRHCIRVTRGSQVTDLLICFECEQAEVWQDGKRIDRWTTGDFAQAIFDEAFKRAGVPLPYQQK